MTEREQVRLDIKKMLNSYRDLKAEQHQLQEELIALERAMSAPSSPSMDGMPRAPGVSNPVEHMVVKHIVLQDRYRAQLARLVEEQEKIEELIESLTPTERMLARYRYIDGMDWESVCVQMCYSWRQTHRIHARMLDKLTNTELKKREASE